MKCTYCGGTSFYEGPSGGASVNVLCANQKCRHWFNDSLGELEDLHRVEPSDEEKAEAAKASEGTTNLGLPRLLVKIDAIYEEGAELYRSGESAKNCLQERDYGGYGAAASNLLRLTGYIDAMNVKTGGR